MKIEKPYLSTLGVLILVGFVGCGTDSSPADEGADPALTGGTISSPDSSGEDVEAAVELTIDSERFLDELAPDEWEAVCEWMVTIQGGPHTVECDEGISITVDTVEVCAEQTEFPHCQLGLLAECVRGQADDLCADAPQACDDFYACVYGTG